MELGQHSDFHAICRRKRSYRCECLLDLVKEWSSWPEGPIERNGEVIPMNRDNDLCHLRAQILASGGAVAEQQQAITALRNTTFSAPEERIRAQTYESMRDNGDHRIF